jgi:mRNA-binding protein PUF3
MEIHNQSDSSSHSTEGEYPFEGKTGSGSLLSTSESDGWNGRSGLPWPTSVNNTSPTLSRNNSHNISPLRQRNGEQNSLPILDANGRALALSSVNRPSFGQMADQAPQNQMNPMSSLASQGPNIKSFSGFEDARLGTEQQSIQRTAAISNSIFVPSASSAQHYASAASDPSMHNSNVLQQASSSRTNVDMQAGTYFRPSAFASKSNFSHNTASRAFHRPFHSTDASLDTSFQDIDDQTGGRDEHLATEIERLVLQGNHQFPQRSRPNHRPTFSSQMSYDISAERSNFRSVSGERFSSGQIPYMPDSSPEHGFQYPPAYHRSTSYGGNRGSSSPSVSEPHHELNSSFYSSASTPPMAPNSLRASCGSGSSSRAQNGQLIALEKKLQGLQPYQNEQQFLQPNPLQMRSSYQQQNEMPYQSQVQMNPLARPYAMPPYSAYSNVQPPPSHNVRYSRPEQESSQVIRSPLLEDFRTNSKTNKRYELKVSTSSSRQMQSLINNRISTIMWLNSVVISMALASFSRNWRTPIPMRRTRFSARYSQTRSN